jgi:hypothetical protein
MGNPPGLAITFTGVELPAVDPLPSWPNTLSPQHVTPLSVITAQV